MNESLSALCDGECDELEVRRVLNQVASDPELREQWRRYHLLGSIMREEPVSSVDLSEGIMQALDGEPMDEVPALAHNASGLVTADGTPLQASQRSSAQWLVSSAVAASVTLAVLVGARFIYEPSEFDASMTSPAFVQSEVLPEPDVAQSVNPMQLAVAAEPAVNDVSAEELRKAQEVLSQYVLEHENEVINANDQTLPPFVRVANFGTDSKATIRKD